MPNQKDPLQQLISDDFMKEDRERLAVLLLPYVIFDKNSKAPHFTESFSKIGNNAEKLELAILAEKARSLLYEKGKNEGLSQRDLVAFDIMPEGSVKSTLKKLSDNKQVRKNAQGYYVPNYRLPKLFHKYLKGEK